MELILQNLKLILPNKSYFSLRCAKVSHSVVDCDWENDRNKQARDFMTEALRHTYCVVSTFASSLQFTCRFLNL
jgi:hypothetical protein